MGGEDECRINRLDPCKSNCNTVINIKQLTIIVYITRVLAVVMETIVKNLGLAGSSEQLGQYIPSLGC